MKFLRQILLEIRNILKSKFILIIGILVLAISLLSPAFGLFERIRSGGGAQTIVTPMGVPYAQKAQAIYFDSGDGLGGDQGPITVGGVTITVDNPLYSNIQSEMQEKDALQSNKGQFSTPEALDLALGMLDDEIQYYAHCSQYVTDQSDYRLQLIGDSAQTIDDRFIYEHGDATADALTEAGNYRKGMDPAAFKKMYIDITPDERQAAFIKADTMVSTVFEVVENNDFAKFIAVSIQQQNDQIDSLNQNIAIQQQAIIDNPSQEDTQNAVIQDLQDQIKMIQEVNIPLLQYRLQKHIVPGEAVWQNNAIDDITSARNQLIYTKIMSEDDFNKDISNKQQYGSYAKYKSTVQAQIDQLNNTVLIAQRSMDAGKPDMKYVSDGARNQTAQFLFFSSIVALFAVLLGGWLIASEYQQGTIRLLMIRPRTRLKILFSKFAAAFAVCLALYAAGCAVNALANGAITGFSDFGSPNYTISGTVGFAAYYLPKFLACAATILLGFTAAFMLSAVSRNIAVSIAVPIVCFVGSILAMDMFAYSRFMGIIAYTPMPYVQMSSFFTQNSYVQSAAQNGVTLSWLAALGMQLVLSAIFVFVAAIVFKKRDITN